MKICLSCEGVTNTSANRCGHCGAWLLPTDAVHYPVRRGEVDAANPLLGTVVDGKYRLQSVLGRGGLGTVFRAQHIGSLMTVAVKLLHPRFAERPEYRRALLPEARRAATVVHERCARVLDVGEDEGTAWLAMELVEGRTLDQVLRSGPLHPSHAVDILLQVAEALVAIHAAGLVHCDLSPRNVMVAPHGGELRVKVLDFGIARSVSLAGSQAHGEFAGFVNPAFAAPELLAGKPVDPRADVWSFGVLAWLLLHGTMPVDDSDPRRAAAAVQKGELRPWPARPGLPRALARLVLACVAIDPADRPATAADLVGALARVRDPRRPAAARLALASLAAGVVLAATTGRDTPARYLRVFSGSPLGLVAGQLSPDQAPQAMPSSRLATLSFHFGGFAAGQLSANLMRNGRVLSGTRLRPEVDAAGGALLLSEAQATWREVVQGLLKASPEGPLDLVFVAPGGPPLGAVRLRVDDLPPTVDAELLPAGNAAIAASTSLRCRVRDDIGVAAVTAHLRWPDGSALELALPRRDDHVALGEALAAELAKQAAAQPAGPSPVAARGAGSLQVVAVDGAGNRGEAPPIAFTGLDVAAPSVVEVTGPAGDPFLPAVDGRVQARLVLATAEPDCTLQVTPPGGEPVEVSLPGPGPTHPLDIPFGQLPKAGAWEFVVTDAAGNRTRRPLFVDVRDREVRLEVIADAASAVLVRNELVVPCTPVALTIGFGANWTIHGVQLERERPGEAPASDGVRLRPGDGGGTVLELPALPAGAHALRFELSEGSRGRLPTAPVVPLRVLPEAIALRVPRAQSRFLPGLIEIGVLAQQRSGAVIEGSGWAVDPGLRPYLRGTVLTGPDQTLALPIVGSANRDDPLLPPVVPLPGRNLVTIELRDVLGRPAVFLVGEPGSAQEPARVTGSLRTEFWWHDQAPAMVGEELLVEYGQPARIKLSCPLPFLPADLPALRLILAQEAIPAATVVPVGGTSTVTFDVPFAVWSVVAGLAVVPRDKYGEAIKGRIDTQFDTPAGPSPVTLKLRTTRSTLAPVTLGELRAGLAPALHSLRLLPVLAPNAPFAEPLPSDSPPRASFRPQVAVAVRNFDDFLLQQTELTWGEARAIVAAAVAAAPPARTCVHRDDPLGEARLQPANLLPASAGASDDASLNGVDFFAAWTLTRLLGVVVAADPDAFRLPLGCELDLAAFGAAKQSACHGAAAHGGAVRMGPFLAPGSGEPAWVGAAAERAAGDVVPTPFGVSFVGLDFGLREWVLDLPNVLAAKELLFEWLSDRDVHLGKVLGRASGAGEPLPDLVAAACHLGSVRGLAFGHRSGLVGRSGSPLDPLVHATVPDHVPGVLRTEQLRRDGRDLLTGATDARLPWVGLRVVGVAARLSGLRSQR